MAAESEYELRDVEEQLEEASKTPEQRAAEREAQWKAQYAESHRRAEQERPSFEDEDREHWA